MLTVLLSIHDATANAVALTAKVLTFDDKDQYEAAVLALGATYATSTVTFYTTVLKDSNDPVQPR